MKFLVLLAIVAYVAADVQSPPVFKILRQSSDVRVDGYDWSFETENGISAQEQGQTRQIGAESPIVATGGYQYTAPDGTPIQVNYVADENGFQPQGAHIPTPPPIPAAIARALEWIAAHPPPPQKK